jgi:hypothetical protein
MGIRTDLLVTEEIAESSDLRATPFEFEGVKRVETALSILEGKWKIAILTRLFARPIWRFSELERAVPGISQRMLSQQLRLLEKCELVKRTVFVAIYLLALLMWNIRFAWLNLGVAIVLASAVVAAASLCMLVSRSFRS